MIRVAIDGPAGVGKSSTSKALAKYYGFAYLDTGAMYRACAWWCMNKGIDLDAETIDEQLVTETVGEFFTEGHFDISVDPDDSKVYADGEDISDVIRSSEVLIPCVQGVEHHSRPSRADCRSTRVHRTRSCV